MARTCPGGHLVEGDNALPNGPGKVTCRACKYAKNHERAQEGPFVCPSCGLPRKRKEYPKTSTCRWCVNPKRRVGGGYVHVWQPDHPLARKDGYVAEHRKVLHDAGVEIPEGAHVHHVNGIKTDNRIENLVVLSPKEHTDEHLPIGSLVKNQYGAFPRWRN